MDETKTSILQIPVSESLVDYFEQLDFEIAGLKVLHSHALRTNVPKEKCEKIKQEFLEKYKELNLLRQEVETEYLKDIVFTTWKLIYNRSMLYVYSN